MKVRLDAYLFENGHFDSRTKAKQSIERGEVCLNGKTIDKCTFLIDDYVKHNIQIVRPEGFVSLGGYKLSKALKDFSFCVQGMTCADIGASTGGFTDCLIKGGADKVFAVDLNDSLLHKSLKSCKKVISVVKNAKELSCDDFGDDLDLLVADLSFISVKLVMETFSKLVDVGKHAILLIKPQFETGAKTRFKNGIIRDEKVKIKACEEVYDCAVNFGFAPKAFTNAPVSKEKNTEFLILLEKGGIITFSKENLHNFFNIHKF